VEVADMSKCLVPEGEVPRGSRWMPHGRLRQLGTLIQIHSHWQLVTQARISSFVLMTFIISECQRPQ
jgi:hypothetical protein